ncbi:GumC family protein [Glacieibacterium frigidum]|uniref:Polysaccharide chain length determinant N-terminal domain-containing protein n=1 Tax=Glacieibacterium frigidum TaxID=2593303 RepID=A0A552UAJ2_9SPHN|nr:hypothetical protein [Glacieibacterium frigidum]TRW15232.1 hypothetical protein FMM06_16525 [Glacieibacterium frigidum]
MTMTQFLLILNAGRWRLLLCVAACVGAAMVFAMRLPPTYEARARVILELVSPDLVTGAQIGADGTESYVRTQQLLAMSERTALRVIDKLGWAENPAVIEAFNNATGGLGDIKTWAARRIMAETAAVPLEGGGTMEIVYRAPEADAAKLIAGLIRESYIETALELQTDGAARRADRYDQLAVQARARLAAAEAAYTGLQRATGTVADSAGNDLESGALGRLQTAELAAAAAGPRRRPTENAALIAQLSRQLNGLEQQIGIALTQLGPANPDYQSLLARRDATRAALSQAVAAAQNDSGIAAARRLRTETEAAYRDERARILARSPEMLKLAQALRQVTVLRADLERIMRNGAELRLQSERTQSGLVVMGDVLSSNEPVAPNIPLIATLATLFGLGLGFVSVTIDGLLRREVLGARDLEVASGVPVLGVVPAGPRGPWQERWTAVWSALRARLTRSRRLEPAEA